MENAEWLRYRRGVELLRAGRFSEGFTDYAARWNCPQLGISPPFGVFPRWRREDLRGKRLFVWPEQGMGDAIMLARFVFALGRAGVDVTLAARAPLARLFEGRDGVRIADLGGSFELSDIDYVATDFEVAAAALKTPDAVPTEPYLFGAPKRRGGIGVVTRGNPKHGNDAARSLPDAEAQRLLALPGAVSLMPEDSGASDMQETADIIAGLDLVVSVDTAVAHLAGAMGKPVRILIPSHDTDWRWGLSGDRSYWYPSARLFRQAGSNWAATLDAVIAELTVTA